MDLKYSRGQIMKLFLAFLLLSTLFGCSLSKVGKTRSVASSDAQFEYVEIQYLSYNPGEDTYVVKGYYPTTENTRINNFTVEVDSESRVCLKAHYSPVIETSGYRPVINKSINHFFKGSDIFWSREKLPAGSCSSFLPQKKESLLHTKDYTRVDAESLIHTEVIGSQLPVEIKNYQSVSTCGIDRINTIKDIFKSEMAILHFNESQEKLVKESFLVNVTELEADRSSGFRTQAAADETVNIELHAHDHSKKKIYFRKYKLVVVAGFKTCFIKSIELLENKRVR